ncbi:hypothetical protein H8E88_17535 [candidate division KSB1 bacterium]|nr:hypothetical protein [candidate division KSB1 bacterium]
MRETKENKLAEIPIEYDWSFSDKTIKDTSYITHGYYTYPAKFIPQLSSRIIKEYSDNNDIIIDPFMGSGTTIVESIVNHRIGIGTDINEIAVLLSKVKTTPIKYDLLLNEFSNLIFKLQHKLNGNITTELENAKKRIILNGRVDYWFKPHIRDKLIIILHSILKINNIDVREYFLITFAQILKSCSIWLQKSVKPTRDFNKKEIDPLYKFEWQARRMIKKFRDFDHILNENIKNNISNYRIIKNNDARNLPCEDSKATLIVTSPPYVTSYEYADLHQLSSLWFGYLNELSNFRKKFIGSFSREREKINVLSKTAENIAFHFGDNKKSIEVENYFADMLESFIEMKRVLKVGGKAAIVIGNTKLKGVEILNAEVFKEQFENIGFKTHKIIHREIPSKMLPSTRDNDTGQFVKANERWGLN